MMRILLLPLALLAALVVAKSMPVANTAVMNASRRVAGRRVCRLLVTLVNFRPWSAPASHSALSVRRCVTR